MVLAGCLVAVPLVAVRDSLASWLEPAPKPEPHDGLKLPEAPPEPTRPNQMVALRTLEPMIGLPPPPAAVLDSSSAPNSMPPPSWSPEMAYADPPADALAIPAERPRPTAQTTEPLPPLPVRPEHVEVRPQTPYATEPRNMRSAPAMEPVSAPIVPVANGPAATTFPLDRAAVDEMEAIRQELERQGASFGRLERWGNEGLFRFQCRLPVGDDPGHTRHFESVGADPLGIMREVLAQVSRFKGRPTQMAQRLPPVSP